MMKKLHLKLVAVSLVLCLGAVPLAQAISLRSSAPVTVDDSYGGSIWKDPCTLDGFVFGAGVVMQNWIAATGDLITAVYMDNCF